MKLIVIEAPKKVNSFKKHLGSGYQIVPTYGHCVDLPEKKLSVNIRKNFEPTFEVKPDSKEVVKTLRSQAKKATDIYLMTDEDREGEAIAWHVYEQIKDQTKANIYRATTNQITKKGIQDALASPGQIDMRKVDAYKARRILDRLCGYKTSYLTQQATGGRSAGRVQSAVLRVIVDRENEIINFVPEEYWVLTAYLLTKKGEQYTAVLTDKIKVPNESEATRIYDEVLKGQPFIKSVEIKEVNVNPYAPFTTLPMMASASTVLGWGAEKTMKVAQSLYEGGHITYHRTDSPFMAQEAVGSIRDFICHEYGQDYLPAHAFVYAAKQGAQEAHECCRPTDVTITPSLGGDERKLYQLIWKRAVASQMSPGRDRRMKVITDISKYDFISTGRKVLFDGFRKVWTYVSTEDALLPDLKKNEETTLKALEKEQKFTSPPPRFSTASLSKFCEKEQISRPATFANIIKTLKDRKYITDSKKSFRPTQLGMDVVRFLVDADVCFVDVGFTADMEKKLDQIQESSSELETVLSDFWTRLKADIENGKKVKSCREVSEYDCPKCGQKLLRKHSRYGPFFVCSNSKATKDKKREGCDYIAKVGECGEPVEKVVKAKEYADFPCKNCGGKMVKRVSKHGEFYGCEGYPKCKTAASLDGTFNEPKKRRRRKSDGHE
jgi:DNA topoisomerase-1